MGANSKIEWTDHTFNPWRGCTKVSDGCKFCYAETWSKRNPNALGVWGPNGQRVIAADSYWRQPLAWNRAAKVAGERPRVFCASLADVFEGDDTMPEASRAGVHHARTRLFDLIDATPNLDWLLLTKRPQNIMRIINETFEQRLVVKNPWPLPNVWLGTSVENQAAADERIPHLLRCPAAVRFLSCEPLLGPLVLETPGPYIQHHGRQYLSDLCGMGRIIQRGIQWVIVGGESGPHARPMHPDWARIIRDQCVAAGVPFFFKQWGEWEPRHSAGWWKSATEKVNPEEGLAMLNDGRTCCRELPAAEQIKRNRAAGRSLGGLVEVDKHALESFYRAMDAGQPETVGYTWMFKAAKHAAGRLLDGRTWDQMPDSD